MKTANTDSAARSSKAKRATVRPLSRSTAPARKTPAKTTANDNAIETAEQQVSARKEKWRQKIQADVKAEMKKAGIPPSPGIAEVAAEEIAKVEQRVSAIGRQVAEFGQQMADLNALIGVAQSAQQAAEEQEKADIEKRPGRPINALATEAEVIANFRNNLAADSPLTTAIAARLFDLNEMILRTPSANHLDLADKISLLLRQLDSAVVGQFVMELAESCRDDARALPAPLPAECMPSAGAVDL
jgi:hypothetical protein